MRGAALRRANVANLPPGRHGHTIHYPESTHLDIRLHDSFHTRRLAARRGISKGRSVTYHSPGPVSQFVLTLDRGDGGERRRREIHMYVSRGNTPSRMGDNSGGIVALLEHVEYPDSFYQ